VARGLIDIKRCLTQIELPLLQVEIDSKFRYGLPHHLKKEFSVLLKVVRLLSIHRDLDRSVFKSLEAFEMVWMRVGHDDQTDLLARNSILLHLAKETWNMVGMTRIDENRYLSADQVRVTVIFVNTLPEVGIKISLKFHPLELLLIFSIPEPCSLLPLNDRTAVVNKKLKFQSA
jgi:hypothetical protein